LSVAREVYSRAVLNALEAGVSVSALAGELGVSRQAVFQMRKRAKPAIQRLADAELAREVRDIERRWEGLVSTFADQFGSMESDRVHQAQLNRQSKAKKARRRTRLSVKGQRLAFAEQRLLAEMSEHREIPVFQHAFGQLTRLEELVQERNRRQATGGVFDGI
jgi:transposase-like protein